MQRNWAGAVNIAIAGVVRQLLICNVAAGKDFDNPSSVRTRTGVIHSPASAHSLHLGCTRNDVTSTSEQGGTRARSLRTDWKLEQDRDGTYPPLCRRLGRALGGGTTAMFRVTLLARVQESESLVSIEYCQAGAGGSNPLPEYTSITPFDCSHPKKTKRPRSRFHMKPAAFLSNGPDRARIDDLFHAIRALNKGSI